jgi:hypothetical protein
LSLHTSCLTFQVSRPSRNQGITTSFCETLLYPEINIIAILALTVILAREFIPPLAKWGALVYNARLVVSV